MPIFADPTRPNNMQANLSLLVSFFLLQMVSNLLLMEFSLKVEPVMKSEMCHPMTRGILNCGSTESISWTLTYNLKYLPLPLIFDLEYNYLIWCSAASKARRSSGHCVLGCTAKIYIGEAVRPCRRVIDVLSSRSHKVSFERKFHKESIKGAIPSKIKVDA